MANNGKGDQKMLTALIQAIINGLGGLVSLIEHLPRSPFIFINDITIDNQILGWINWIIPLEHMLAIIQLWLSAFGIWLLVSRGLRWAKII